MEDIQEEELACPLLPPEETGDNVVKQKNPRRVSSRIGQVFFGTKRRKICMGVLFSSMVVLLVVGLVGYYVVAPKFISGYINDTVFQVVQVDMIDPNADSLRMRCSIAVTANLPISGRVEPASSVMLFNGSEVGRMQIDPMEMEAGNHTKLFISDHRMNITNMTAFVQMAYAAIQSTSVTWELVTDATVVGVIKTLEIPFHHIAVHKILTVPGIGGLNSAQVLDFNVLISNDGTPIVDAVVALKNPSVFNFLPSGNLSFFYSVFGSPFGTVNIPSSDLVYGTNIVNGVGLLQPVNILAADELFTVYLGGNVSDLYATGAGVQACSFSLYSQVFAMLSMDMMLPGLSRTNLLIEKGTAAMDTKMVWDGLIHGHLIAPVQLYMRYPFTAPLVITGVHLDILHAGKVVGIVDVTFDPAERIILRDKRDCLTQKCPVIAQITKDNFHNVLQLAKELEDGMTMLECRGEIDFNLGRFALAAKYHQEGIPTCSPFSAESKCGISPTQYQCPNP